MICFRAIELDFTPAVQTWSCMLSKPMTQQGSPSCRTGNGMLCAPMDTFGCRRAAEQTHLAAFRSSPGALAGMWRSAWWFPSVLCKHTSTGTCAHVCAQLLCTHQALRRSCTRARERSSARAQARLHACKRIHPPKRISTRTGTGMRTCTQMLTRTCAARRSKTCGSFPSNKHNTNALVGALSFLQALAQVCAGQSPIQDWPVSCQRGTVFGLTSWICFLEWGLVPHFDSPRDSCDRGTGYGRQM